MTDALLVLAVLAVLLGCLGFARLSAPLDRLHCATFVSCAAGLPLLLAAFATEGAKASVLKVVFLLVCGILSGSVLSHALGRALTWREREGGQ